MSNTYDKETLSQLNSFHYKEVPFDIKNFVIAISFVLTFPS